MSETRWLSQEERVAWLRFAAVLELLPGVLDAQLVRDADLTHFDYFTMAMLSEAPGRTLGMSALAARTNATLPRLSRVVSRLEDKGYVVRTSCLEDRRVTDASLTRRGWKKLTDAAPGHVSTVRSVVLDALTPTQLRQLSGICDRLLIRLDPDRRVFAETATEPSSGRARAATAELR